MKTLRTLGLGLILAVSGLFISLLFMGQYTLSSATFENFITDFKLLPVPEIKTAVFTLLDPID